MLKTLAIFSKKFGTVKKSFYICTPHLGERLKILQSGRIKL